MKKFSFEVRDLSTNNILSSYDLIINPQDYNFTVPTRVNAIQTKGGVFIDDFGLGIGTLSLRGVVADTIRNSQSQTLNTAFEQFKKLYRIVHEEVFKDRLPGIPVSKVLYVFNYTDNLLFITMPQKFTLNRSSSKPYLYQYDINLIVIYYSYLDEYNPQALRGDLRVPAGAMGYPFNSLPEFANSEDFNDPLKVFP